MISITVADIVWSAYALAMFTEEERNAAAGGHEFFEPPDTGRPIPDPTPATPRTAQGSVIDGLDSNVPAEAAELFRRGWRYEAGRWIRSGALGEPADPDGMLSGRVGLSSIQSAAVIGGGSVLGYSVPVAPPVLLPSFVGGKLGRVNIGGGMRPASGGTERVVFGGGSGRTPIMPEVRF